ncbi:MAG: glycosyltransferase family 1 protein [Ruminococcaceae bacterium]|nr:glycosyltransferase family 1 protein [Oscillospiraceae bacterium]
MRRGGIPLNRKRVCIYCQKWESGGIESFLYNVLSRTDLSALEVDLVVEQLGESVFTQRLREKGICFVELSGSVRRAKENERAFRRLLAVGNYSAVWLNVYQGMALRYLRMAKTAGVGVRIAHSHNTDLRQSHTREIKLWLHRRYSKIYAKDATALWACSEAAAKFMFLPTLLQERGYTFIPNGIETERFRFDPAVRETVRQELGLNDRFVIGNVGRLCYQKNQSFLLDVLVEARKLRPESCLLLVGDGEDRQMLEEKAQALGIADYVMFCGTTNQVEKLFWAMDVFAFPSRFEGLGIVAVEAQAAGLPVVCSQYVPQEASVTARLRKLPPTAATTWAEELCGSVGTERELGAQEVFCAGFDVNAVAKAVKWS